MTAEEPGRATGARRLIKSCDPRDARGVALVLHGGGGRGAVPVSPVQPSVLRMVPIAWRIVGVGRGRIAVFRLRNAYRGFGRDPLADVRWALDRIRRSHPGYPVALVGHSLGGTVALAAAGERGVRSVVALAPWLTGGDRFDAAAEVSALIVHGSDDRVTDPAVAARYAAAARAEGAPVSFVGVEGGSHAMLRHRSAFETLPAQFVRITLEPDGRPRRGRIARLAQAAVDHPDDFTG